MIELLCTDNNKKATFIHYYLRNAVLGIYQIQKKEKMEKLSKRQSIRNGIRLLQI